MRPAVLAFFALVVASCDSATLLGGDTPFVYATEGTDRAVDLIQAPDGGLVVVGSTEGVPRPADGTLALPSLLRFDLGGELQTAAVYRDIGYGDVEAVVQGQEGLVIALSAGPDGPGDRVVGVYETDAEGRRKDVLLESSQGYLPPRSLVAIDGGVVAAVYPTRSDGLQVYRIDAEGQTTWQTRLDRAQDVRGVVEAPGGDVYVYGPGDATTEGWIVARLDGQTGAERWRRVRPETTIGMIRTASGLALLEDALAPGERTVRVAWIGSDGQERGTWTVEQSPIDPESGQGAVRGVALAALPDGGLAIGVREWFGWETPAEAHVRVLDAEGRERARYRFGVEDRWSDIADLEVLADGRLAVAGNVGPRHISGYGGDDYDIHVSLYSLD